VIGTRLLLAAALAAAVPITALADGPGIFRRPRADQARVRVLAEVIRSEADEGKRKAAVLELAEADPRANPDVLPALLAAMKRDASAAVRATAAEVIGRFRVVFPTAGAALETAAETDPSRAVRDAAKQALWEYHLGGYRSAKGLDGVAAQTAEPPIAKPARPRPVATATAEPPLAPVVPTVAAVPVPRLPAVSPALAAELRPGPRVLQLPGLDDPRQLLSTTTPTPSQTAEPPIAPRGDNWVPPPTTPEEPPFLARRPGTLRFGQQPKLIMELPPIVPHPGPIPGVVPFPEPTAEPPIRKTAAD
jgi:hypothetical protein